MHIPAVTSMNFSKFSSNFQCMFWVDSSNVTTLCTTQCVLNTYSISAQLLLMINKISQGQLLQKRVTLHTDTHCRWIESVYIDSLTPFIQVELLLKREYINSHTHKIRSTDKFPPMSPSFY